MFLFFFPRKGKIGVLRKPCWKNWNPENAEELWWEKSVSLEKCRFLIQFSRTSCCTCLIRACTEETAPSRIVSCDLDMRGQCFKMCLFFKWHTFRLLAFVAKSLFSVSSLLNLSCLQKVWDLVAVSVFKVDSEKQAFGPPPSFLGLTSRCSLGLLFKLQTVGRITVTLKQNRLRESSSTETKCFLPYAVKPCRGSYRRAPSEYIFISSKIKIPAPVLRFVFCVWTLTCASLLPFAVCKFSSPIKKRPLPPARMREVEQICVFLLTCVNPAECVTSESVTALFSGMFERFFVPLRSYF